MRRAAKVDSNQAEIVSVLRAAGAEVQPLHTVGQGCPDVLVAFRGQWFLGEIKDGSLPPSRQKLTDDEAQWHERFSRAAPVYVWTCAEDALTTIGALS